MPTTLFFNLGPTEIIVIAAIILLLFGGAKIPELMRGLGKGVKEFKNAQKDITDQLNDEPAKKEETKADPEKQEPEKSESEEK